ncbi:MAG: hypothetical protein AAB270_01575, partial [Chloroflexota bacterium]
MRRRFRLLRFKKSTGDYLSLVVEWQDAQGTSRSKVVRSYGAPLTPPAVAQADVEELQRLAGDQAAPIPVGTLSDAIWAGLQETLANPVATLPALPLLVARDLAHLGGYLLAQASGELEQKVAATQPGMPEGERGRFVAWLRRLPEEDQALALA